MAENSKIEWCDHTFNPWKAAQSLPGCAHCYAGPAIAALPVASLGPRRPRRHTSPANWKQPLAWERKAADGICAMQTGAGEPIPRRPAYSAPRSPIGSMTKVPRHGSPSLDLIRSTPHLDWLLTKRPQLWRDRMEQVVALEIADGPSGADQCYGVALAAAWLNGLAAANVWVGTTVEDQTRADERIPALLRNPRRHPLPLLQALARCLGH